MYGQTSTSPQEMRNRICQSKGILGGFRTAHNIIARSVNEPQKLLQKGLDAETLKQLGYTQQGMLAIGYSETALQSLGYC
ncbi:MAG: hypothetical protein KC917_09315 [Candidatus Omnitrophica bacterium]|nr:hypothetical protein [Candidatus Omnitrophota bacterium]MCA9416458.1 hypothetical protein [Candidatus Omnitrophota bacterium]MCA9439999.1 hypothetical protein [Candidatus Omnitrophota bacterium]